MKNIEEIQSNVRVFGMWNEFGVIKVDAEEQRQLFEGKGVRLSNSSDEPWRWQRAQYHGCGFLKDIGIDAGAYRTLLSFDQPTMDTSVKIAPIILCIHSQFVILNTSSSDPFDQNKIEIKFSEVRIADRVLRLADVYYDKKELAHECAMDLQNTFFYLDQNDNRQALEAKNVRGGVQLSFEMDARPGAPTFANSASQTMH